MDSDCPSGFCSAGRCSNERPSRKSKYKKNWFGIAGHTLNEVFDVHHWPIADLVAGIAYLIYVVEYLALAMLVLDLGVFHRRPDL